MKKIIGFLLVFTLMFTVCGCQKEELSSSNTTEEEFSLGKITENIYENDFIGIRYTLDEDWVFYDDEQLMELNNITVDTVADVAGDEVKELLKEVTIFYDMYATDSDQLNNVSIGLEKVDASQLSSMDMKKNFEATIPILKESFQNMGFENINCETTEIEVDGKILDALHTSAEVSGVGMYQTTFQKKCNGYLANITITTYFDDIASDLIDNFGWIE